MRAGRRGGAAYRENIGFMVAVVVGGGCGGAGAGSEVRSARGDDGWRVGLALAGVRWGRERGRESRDAGAGGWEAGDGDGETGLMVARGGVDKGGRSGRGRVRISMAPTELGAARNMHEMELQAFNPRFGDSVSVPDDSGVPRATWRTCELPVD